MDTQKFTGKQMLIILGLNVLAGVIAGIIVYQFTKPKATDPSTTTPPAVAKQGTTQTVTTTPVTTTGEG